MSLLSTTAVFSTMESTQELFDDERAVSQTAKSASDLPLAIASASHFGFGPLPR